MVRVLHVIVALYGTLHPSDRGILVRTHVDNIVVALILYGTAGVVLLDCSIAILEVVARAGFVTKAPYYN